MSKVDAKSLASLKSKHFLLKDLFQNWVNAYERPRNITSVRRVRETLATSGVVASTNEVVSALQVLEGAGILKLEKSGSVRFIVPMKNISAALGGREVKVAKPKAPQLAQYQHSQGSDRYYALPLDKFRTVGLSLPDKITKEDLELITQFIERLVE